MELQLFSSILTGKIPVEQMSGLHRAGWERVIRRQGGYWSAQFEFMDESRATCNDFFYTALGGHLQETDGGITTWEGMVSEIDSPAKKDSYWVCAAQAIGYVHTLSWQKLAGAYVDSATGNGSAWIADMITNQAPFIVAQNIATNTIQVVRAGDFNRTPWDEICRVTELGDGGTGIWRFFISANRTANYQAIDRTTVKYFVRGGMIRRRSLIEMSNYIYGAYTDSAGTETALAAATTAQSVAKYGRRETKIRRQNIPTAAMESLRDSLLLEDAYPWPKVLGSAGPVDFLDAAQQPVSPWQVTPGIIRDMSYPVSAGEVGGFLPDRRDTYPDEIVCGPDGASVRSWMFKEADLLATQYDYAASIQETDYDLRD